jgi:hypothetical protein
MWREFQSLWLHTFPFCQSGECLEQKEVQIYRGTFVKFFEIGMIVDNCRIVEAIK